MDIARETALRVLYDVNEKNAYANISLNKYLEADGLRPVDKAFITDLVYGTLKWQLTIDWIIGRFSSIKVKKISPWILNILRLGIYQLIYMDKIPESAACNECVGLSKKYGHAASSRFVNGVLRNVARSKGQLPCPEEASDPLGFLSVKYAHPLWMVKDWTERFGKAFTQGLLEANNQIPEFTVRANTLKQDREQLMTRLKAEGLDCEAGRYLPEAVILRNPSSISRLEAFKEGCFQVQDESSMLVSRVLNPQPGEFVMDVCSAPGGKTTHIAQLMGNRGRLLARDDHEHKVHLVQQAAARLGLDIIQAERYDATIPDERYMEKADRVLVDAPCTGLGIIRRKPDIKWARKPEDKASIAALQKKILDTVSMYVRKGGTLVYSTCTIEEEENGERIRDFLAGHPDFTLEDITESLPEALVKPTAKEGFVQLFPHVDGIDGFFIARMKRREG